MNSMIFYATTKPACDKMIVVGKRRKGRGSFVVYLRTEVVAADAVHALDMAKPQPEETVLNAIEL